MIEWLKMHNPITKIYMKLSKVFTYLKSSIPIGNNDDISLEASIKKLMEQTQSTDENKLHLNRLLYRLEAFMIGENGNDLEKVKFLNEIKHKMMALSFSSSEEKTFFLNKLDQFYSKLSTYHELPNDPQIVILQSKLNALLQQAEEKGFNQCIEETRNSLIETIDNNDSNYYLDRWYLHCHQMDHIESSMSNNLDDISH